MAKISQMLPEISEEITDADQLAKRWSHAIRLLRDCIDANPKLRAGVPCIKGTRITAAQVLAQLAEGESVREIAEDMSIDQQSLASFLDALSIILDRPTAP